MSHTAENSNIHNPLFKNKWHYRAENLQKYIVLLYLTASDKENLGGLSEFLFQNFMTSHEVDGFLYSHHMSSWQCIDAVKRNKLLINRVNYLFSGERSRGLPGVTSSGSRSRRTGEQRHIRFVISASKPYQSAAGRVSTAETNRDVTTRGTWRVEINEHWASEWNRVSGKQDLYVSTSCRWRDEPKQRLRRRLDSPLKPYVCGWNPNVWPFKWKLLSSTFLRYCILCCARWF